MPPAIKNPFKRKTPANNKDKLVLKHADKNTTEISIARVTKTSQVSPASVPLQIQFDNAALMDAPALRSLLRQRDDQIASLKNEMAELISRLNEIETQAAYCSCGAYERTTNGPSIQPSFSRW